MWYECASVLLQLVRKNGLLAQIKRSQQTALGDGEVFCELSQGLMYKVRLNLISCSWFLVTEALFFPTIKRVNTLLLKCTPLRTTQVQESKTYKQLFVGVRAIGFLCFENPFEMGLSFIYVQLKISSDIDSILTISRQRNDE